MSLASALAAGLFRDPSHRLEKIPDIRLTDIYHWAMEDTKIKRILTGMKRTDTLWRRRTIANFRAGDLKDVLVFPIAEWTKFVVLSYMNAHNLPVPAAHKAQTTRVTLTNRSIRWLHDTYPDDFAKLLKVFPYGEAVVKRRSRHIRAESAIADEGRSNVNVNCHERHLLAIARHGHVDRRNQEMFSCTRTHS
jgi:Phosphoadenosine phosphosulfate reductase family